MSVKSILIEWYYSNMKLSKPQPNLNTTVGFDMKMTVHTATHPPTTETQYQEYLSCFLLDFDEIVKTPT